MHDAAKEYEASHETAAATLRAASERFAADAAGLGDDDLPVELELVRAMTTLVEANAPQGTLYGQY